MALSLPAAAVKATAGKLERIRQLADHGLNTPQIVLIEAGTCFDANLRRRLEEAARGDELMTIRTYHPIDEITHAKGPFQPEIPVDEAIRVAEELAPEWNVLFQEAIDVNDTNLAGNFTLTGEGAGRFEALAGAYRVRDVEEPPEGAQDHLRTGDFSHPDDIAEPSIRDAATRVMRSGLLESLGLEGDDEILLEFNVQVRPVGERREPLLFWEWRPVSLARRVGPSERFRAPEEMDGKVVGIGVPGLPGPEGPRSQLDGVLGGKGAGLWAMRRANLPIPPSAVLSVAVLDASGGLPREWADGLDEAVTALSRSGKDDFGVDRPFLLAVRSSPAVSMPGLLETVLNVDPIPAAVAAATRQVLDSWHSPRAASYRETHGIPDSAGLAVVLQPMIFGDRDDASGSGVGFTRDPATGQARLVVEFAKRALGPAVVGGETVPEGIEAVEQVLAGGASVLESWARTLERVGEDVQEFEFAIESTRPFLLQTRSAKRSMVARVRTAYDLVEEGVIDAERARELLGRIDTRRLLRRRLAAEDVRELDRGRTAAPGTAVGRVALGPDGSKRLREAGDPVVLVTRALRPSLYPHMSDLAGVVTRLGGVTSHAAVLALEVGIPAVVGCRQLEFDSTGSARFGSTAVAEGDWLSVEAAEEGRVFAGRLAEGPPERPDGLPADVVSWAQSLTGVAG